MRILEDERNISLKKITICLTNEEASELRDALEDLLQKSDGNHSHISDFESDKEITVCLYEGNNDLFPERLKKLIDFDM